MTENKTPKTDQTLDQFLDNLTESLDHFIEDQTPESDPEIILSGVSIISGSGVRSGDMLSDDSIQIRETGDPSIREKDPRDADKRRGELRWVRKEQC